MPRTRQVAKAKGTEAEIKRAKAGSPAPLDAALQLFEALPVPVFFKSRDGKYVGVNKAWEEFFGLSRESFLGKLVKDLYPQSPAIAQKHLEMDGKLWRKPGGQSYEATVTTRDGRVRDTIYYKATFANGSGEVAGLMGAIVDITARKQAEAALRESEERFRSVGNSANEAILVYDKQLNVIAGNLAAERILGLPLADIIGAAGFTSLLPCVHADGSPVLPDERPTRLTVKSGKPLTGQIVGIYRPDSSMTWVSVNTGFLRRPGETDWYGVVSTIGDITKQRQAEFALSASEALYRQTFELATAGIAHVDLSGRFKSVNRRLCEMLGYTEKELIGRAVKELSHPEDRHLTDAQRAPVHHGELDSLRFEKRYLKNGGQIVWVDLAVALARDEHGHPQYEVAPFADITNPKKAEAAPRTAPDEP